MNQLNTFNHHKFTAKAMALFVHEGKLLLYPNRSHDGIMFYRPPGGHINHGEHALHAVIREVKEEMGAKLTNVVLWRVLENMFTADHTLHHEYVFCFTAEFEDKNYYAMKQIRAEEGGREQLLCWYSKQDIETHKMFVVPTGIVDVLS